MAFSWPVVTTKAQPSGSGDAESEVLTRGPVHEAFAGVVSYNPEPGVVVKTAPPDPIEEIPPEEKPDGDDVAWIPGYWAWDDERNDYLWISGTWRALPPGREWIAGYWREERGGYQWISGYWADSEMRDITYLPPPPESLEVGPNIDPPSLDYGWTPGCWEWRESRYVWRAGYWSPGRADWVWVPSCFVWTPRGYIFVPGYWDYVVERRGLLFAPVYYRSPRRIRRDYHYEPRIVISLSIFDDCLFLRPAYHHYYFGDYYDPHYDRSGFYMSFSFQSSRRGYDPFYSHRRWEHREDRDWDNRYRASYQHRRENEAARPPRTWAAQTTVNTTVVGGQSRAPLAEPIEQVVKRKDGPVRFKPVDEGERQKFTQRGREVQRSREERRTVEAAAVANVKGATGTIEPAKVPAPRTPIVGKPAKERSQVPPDPPRASKPDSGRQPGAETSGRPDATSRATPGDSRKPEREKRDAPDRRSDAVRDANVPPTAEPRAGDERMRAREEPQGKARETEARDKERDDKSAGAVRAQQQAEERAAAKRASEESQRKEQLAREKAQPDESRRNSEAEAAARAQRQAEERAAEAAARAREDARKAQPAREKEPADEARAQRQAEERANENAARARAESQKVQPPSGKESPDGGRRARDADDSSKADQAARAKARAAAEEAEKDKEDKEKTRER